MTTRDTSAGEPDFVVGLAPGMRRALLLDAQQIGLVLDVGANVGQFACMLRSSGYDREIHSFEPLPRPFAALDACAADDPRWHTHQIALGHAAQSAVMNVAEDTRASSLLPWADRPYATPSDRGYHSTQLVPIAPLDSLRDNLTSESDRTYLKIDVEGYELEVLRGGASWLPQVRIVELEVSLLPTWKGAPRLRDLVGYLNARGFREASIEPVAEDPKTGCMVAVDIVFLAED